MAHDINTVSKVYSSSNYLNMPIQAGIDRKGFWYEYKPVNGNNDTLGASIVPYRWGSPLQLPNNGSEVVIDGTLSLISEPWDGSNYSYHNGSIVHIGSGINDITGAQEEDALFFPHLGSLSPSTDDNAFYWDRLYKTIGSDNWLFYQYHKHLPSFYQTYENGRITLSSVDYISPSDKSYGYMIHTKIRVASSYYQSVMLRVHTPSVGGAHNSHNDITLPTNNSKDYLSGGLLKGAGDRFHIFYIAQNGSNWDVFTRTYVHTSASCTAEVLLGTFNLADPTIDTTGTIGAANNYPIRASVGEFLNGYIYVPVILNNSTSGYDLEIWEMQSSTSLSPSTLTRYTILSGEQNRPDCHLTIFNDQIHLITTKGNTVAFYAYENEIWTESSTPLVTNGNPLRIHGFRYNTEEVFYYALISGVNSSTGTYSGPGIYKFDTTGDFNGYAHLDYNYTDHSFTNKAEKTAGYTYYSAQSYNLIHSDNEEPQGITQYMYVLKTELPSPEFFNPTKLGINEVYVYQGKELKDNRKLFVGRIEQPYGDIEEQDDLFIALVSQDGTTKNYFYYDGVESGYKGGNDYISGVVQSTLDPNKVWITGSTKSELVERKDIRIHGYCRRFSDNPNYLKHVDITTDSQNNIIVLNEDSTSGYGTLIKYDYNYNIIWQKLFYNDGEDFISPSKLCVDSSNNIYTTGSTSSGSVYVNKFDSNGNIVWFNSFSQAGLTYTTPSIIILSGTSEKLALNINDSINNTSTIILSSLDSVILSQRKFYGININKFYQSTQEDNKLIYAGKTSSSLGTFGIFEIINNIPYIKVNLTTANNCVEILNSNTDEYIVISNTINSSTISKISLNSIYEYAEIWSVNINNTIINSALVDSTDKSIYLVGRADSSGITDMGMGDGFVCRFTDAGILDWQNVFGHDMLDEFVSVTSDMYNRNLLIAGFSRSHTYAQDGVFFRCDKAGYGTGRYHPPGNTGMPYFYLASNQTHAANLSTFATTANLFGSGGDSAQKIYYTHIIESSSIESETYDGSYGPGGVFGLFFGYLELDKIQQYLNSQEYKDRVSAGLNIHPANSFITLWQVHTVGDGTADDGNSFGYDIIESSNGIIYVAGQSSGDVGRTNGGPSGVYDVLGIEYFQVNTEIEGETVLAGNIKYYQDGDEFDEEIYACTELSNGKIAFCGRTAGTIGGTNYGGYDILLGIYNPIDDSIIWEQIGSGLNDRGINIHDIGNNLLAIVFETSGEIGSDTHIGSEDIGIIFYNYQTNTWGSAYQTGTAGTELLSTIGKPSVKLTDGRIAICFSTSGNFNSADTTSSNKGFLDIGLAIFNPGTMTWQKAQIGSQTSEVATSIDAIGSRLLISGYITESFEGGSESIFVTSDSSSVIKGINSV